MLLAEILTHIKIMLFLFKSEIRLNSGYYHEHVATDDLVQLATVSSDRSGDVPPAIRPRSRTLSNLHTVTHSKWILEWYIRLGTSKE